MNKASISLSEEQQEEIKKVTDKISSGFYKFTKLTDCPCCNNSQFETIAEYDRYGFYNPNVICKDCGLIFSNPMWTEESVSDFYEHHYRTIYSWGALKSIKETFKSFEDSSRILTTINDMIPLDSKMKILEVGCGGGWHLKKFKDNNFNNLTGIDLGSDYINYGKERYNIDLQNTAIDKLSDTYDLIILSHLLEHIIDLDSFIQQLSQRINPQGYLYIELPGILMTGYTYGKLNRSLQNAHTYYFTLATLTNIMNKNGFSLVKGDEWIQSVWQYTGVKTNSFSNEYLVIKIYLNQILPLQEEISSLKQQISSFDSLRWSIKSSILYRTCRKIYRIFKNK